jgi:hypothetical protein
MTTPVTIRIVIEMGFHLSVRRRKHCTGATISRNLQVFRTSTKFFYRGDCPLSVAHFRALEIARVTGLRRSTYTSTVGKNIKDVSTRIYMYKIQKLTYVIPILSEAVCWYKYSFLRWATQVLFTANTHTSTRHERPAFYIRSDISSNTFVLVGRKTVPSSLKEAKGVTVVIPRLQSQSQSQSKEEPVANESAEQPKVQENYPRKRRQSEITLLRKSSL